MTGDVEASSEDSKDQLRIESRTGEYVTTVEIRRDQESSFHFFFATHGESGDVVCQIEGQASAGRAEAALSQLLASVRLLSATVASEGGVASIRATHPNAYNKWNPGEDDELRRMHSRGETVAEIARRLGRQESAIQSRLARLGLQA